MQLSPAQQDAVDHEGSPALVVAGAGSGKTRTLTAKFSHLVDQGHDPKRILAITFTNKAADEMKSRLMKMTGLDYKDFHWVRTYHSACLMILKQHCDVMGYASPVQVFSVYQQEKLSKELCVKNNIEKKYANRILSSISRAKNFGNPEKYFELKPGFFGIRVQDIFVQYEARLKEMNSVDFDNILLKTRDLLRDNEKIRTYYQNYFSYILVDEYQDTNNLQDDLTNLLLGEHRNLFCVGDDWQAVYGFRGSNVNHFLDFPQKYKDSKIFRLEENYRSANEIVQVANDLIDYNPDKMEKKCFSQKKGGVVEIYDFMSDTHEAEWVARRIKGMNRQGQGISLDKIAVVYRTKFCSLPFEKIFRAYRIPYSLKGSQGFFERMEILDINSYLSAAVFPGDDVSFERILNTPKRGIGPSMVKKMAQMRSQTVSLQDAARMMISDRVLTKKVHENLSRVLEILDEICALSPATAMEVVIEKTGYLDYLEKLTKTPAEFISKKENLEQLIFTARPKDTMLEYLEEASLIREDKSDDEDSDTGGVSLLTIHSAKGLEYDTVFIVGCEERLFPHWRSIDAGDAAISEERRLMYVAMTRAERFLYLTHANYRKGEFNAPSRFLGQIKECMS
ncbi:MAG: UvrD-helicase domain-containing protein [Proteobacteria bacterium]|nr:UvrD-helicase domain-containing protein [Pseudomonadota bacterium]MBU1386255.1 UvrD-helicase domain-containing protein [Pseudomonadota bacterium]MBU1542948.1 UvrD-helicase domain-containing protein [Pseudomonadota bacterium]MBU2479970.1 UvrD-helicase domain-containing protein [Pseudomonadota bacterium]